MSRNLLPSVAWRLGREHRGVYMVFIDLGEGIYVHSRLGKIVYGGNTYLGVGNMGIMDAIAENGELLPANFNLRLSGIEQHFWDYILNQPYQNKEVVISYAVLDDVNFSNSIIGEPFVMFNGVTGAAKIPFGDTKAEVILEVVDETARWEASVDWRYNNASQQALYAGDTGMRHVEEAQTPLTWGGA